MDAAVPVRHRPPRAPWPGRRRDLAFLPLLVVHIPLASFLPAALWTVIGFMFVGSLWLHPFAAAAFVLTTSATAVTAFLAGRRHFGVGAAAGVLGTVVSWFVSWAVFSTSLGEPVASVLRSPVALLLLLLMTFPTWLPGLAYAALVPAWLGWGTRTARAAPLLSRGDRPVPVVYRRP